MRQTKGITLIALIITIIILLILAMVTINILINQGIIGHANNAVDKYDEQQVKEQVLLDYDEWKMQKFGESAKSLYDFFNEKKTNGDYTNVEKDGTTAIKITKTGSRGTYTFKLEENGNLSSLKGLILDKNKVILEYEEGKTAKTTIKATLTDISGEATWSIADSSIATISGTTGESITVTSVNKGTTTITATCGKYTATCEVVVQKKLPIGEPINYKCYSTVAEDNKSKLYYKSPEDKNGYGDQEFEVTKDLDWRILGRNEDGYVIITTAETVLTKDNKEMYLKDSRGYCTGIDELNNASRIYGYGEHATGARSVNFLDVFDWYTGNHSKTTYSKGSDGYIYRNGNIGSKLDWMDNPDYVTDFYYYKDGEYKELKIGESVQVDDFYIYGTRTAKSKAVADLMNGHYWFANRGNGNAGGQNYMFYNVYRALQTSSSGSIYVHPVNTNNSMSGPNKGQSYARPIRPVVILDCKDVEEKVDEVWQIPEE